MNVEQQLVLEGSGAPEVERYSAAPVRRQLEAMRRRLPTWTAVAEGIGVDGELLAQVMRDPDLTEGEARSWAHSLDMPPVLLWPGQWRPITEGA